MDGAGPSSSSNADATPTQKRVQPQRMRRGVNVGNEIDQTIIEAQTWRAEKPLLDPDHPIHLTTDSSYAETAIDLGRIVKTFKHEQYYTRPEVIELYRKQRNIATPEVVSLKEKPSLARFRPREVDKTIVLNAQSDEVYQKRHRALEAYERRTRFRELEILKQEHRKLKERIEKLAVMDYMAFLSLPADKFSPVPPVDLSNSFSEEVQQEGERRREEMLEAARTLDERYQFLLREEPKPEKKSKAASRLPQTPAKAISAPVDEAMDVEVVEDADREHGRQEEVVTARPPIPPTSAAKPKNKGGRPRVIHAAQTNSVAQGSNAVASGSGRKPGRASQAPTASSLGKRRAGSSVAIEPIVNRTPSPPPPSSTVTDPREMSVDMIETDRVSMEVSDVRTPMPPTPAPPPAVLTLRHRVIEMTEPPLAASPPPAIQPEHLPVVQGADEDEIISHPRKRLRMSTKPPPAKQSSAPPASPSRTAPRWKTPSPAPVRTAVRRAPSLPPIVSLSSAELEAEHEPEAARESSPVPALETMLEPAPEPLPEFQPPLEELPESLHEPPPELEELPEALPEALPEPLPETEPGTLPEAPLELPPAILPETLPGSIPETLPEAASPAKPLAAPEPLAKRERSNDGDAMDFEAKAESSTSKDLNIRGPRAPRCVNCKGAKSRCEARTENDTCKRCLDHGYDCYFPSKKVVLQPAPDNVAGHEPRVQSEAPTAAAPSPSIHIMTPAPSIPALSPSVKMRSPSPEVPVVTTSRRGRGGRSGARPRVKGEPLIVQAAQRAVATRRKAQRHTDAFGAKLPEILKSVDEYDYELPEDIVDDVPRMTGLTPDGSPSEDRESELEERLQKIPDLLPLSSMHSSDVSNLTTRNTTPAVRAVAAPSKDPESDNDL